MLRELIKRMVLKLTLLLCSIIYKNITKHIKPPKATKDSEGYTNVKT